VSDPDPHVRAWRVTLAGLCATLVGIGLARFAYTPLLPALITEGWFPASQAAYLGAANLAGYLAGALSARRLARSAGAPRVLRGMMALVTVAFFACALPLSFAWFFLWRFASGVAGGALMVLAAPTVLPRVPAVRRGLAGGAVFTGVGLGIMASGTVVPLLLQAGLVQTWCGLGVLSLLLTALAWGGWPAREPAAPTRALPRPPVGGALLALYLAYTNPDTLSGIGVSLRIVFAVVLGGMYSLLGPFVGTALTIALSEYLRIYFGIKLIGIAETIYGLLLIVFIIFLPAGIWGSLGRWLGRFQAARPA